MSEPNPLSVREMLTYDDYVAIPNDRYRHEIIEGAHFVNPAPSTYHQTVSRRLQFQLYEKIELSGRGVVFDAPCDVQLSENDIVQPDLIVVLKENSAIIAAEKIVGTPDMIVEILSPSSRHSDQVLKKQIYERSKVREYWIVDPFEHSIAAFILSGDAYLPRPISPGPYFSLSIEPSVQIDLARIW